MKADMSVLVSSCDRYIDLMTQFKCFVELYWEDCYYEINVVTETNDPSSFVDGFFSYVFCEGLNKSWSERLLGAINKVSTKYVMLVLDDFFLSESISNYEIENYIETMEKERAVAYKLVPSLDVSISEICLDYGELKKGVPYRVTAQVTIWEREYLKKLLYALGSAEMWNFERMGSVISNEFDGKIIGAMQGKGIKYVEVVCAGRWIDTGLRFLDNSGVKYDINMREVEPQWYFLYRRIRGLVFNLFPRQIARLRLCFQKGK